jgi:GMP reductase
MKIEDGIKLDYSDVLFRPKRSTLTSRKEVDLQRTYKFKHSGWEYTGVPIMAANMDGVGTFDMASRLYDHRMFTCFVKSYTLDDYTHCETENGTHFGNHVAVSTGTSEADYANLQEILDAYPEFHFICIDVANGYSEAFGDFVAKVRKRYPEHTIIAGNVVTADMTQELILRGADIIKVGIGPGSVCTTRIKTGVGYPQLSAVAECADAAHGLGAHIIADGGCTCPGDVAKAFGAGADFVMLGGMFAGHDEGGGTVDPSDNTITFYGMSSDTAMNKHHGGVADYRSSEGRTVKIPYRGPIENTVKDILGGIRSTCTYVGASELKHLSKCTTFIRVNNQFNNVFSTAKY